MAPEIIEKNEYSKKSDVYAFAMIAWEIFSEESPFQEEQNVMQIIKLVCNEQRPDLNKISNASLKKLIKANWDADPNKRMEMAEIYQNLEEMQKEFK